MRTFRVLIIALVVVGVLAACTLLRPRRAEPESTDADRTFTAAQEPAQANASPKEQPPASVVATLPPEHARARIRRRMAALIADTVDPLPQSETGYYMDLQEANLRKALQGRDIDILRRGNRLVLTLGDELGFATGETRLPATAEEALAALAPVLAQYPKTFVAIHGYTDPSGGALYNRRLSKQRGLRVARQLVAGGVAPERMAAIGHGESGTGASEASSPDGPPTRRIEIHLLPFSR